jgi:hypothetical protein
VAAEPKAGVAEDAGAGPEPGDRRTGRLYLARELAAEDPRRGRRMPDTSRLTPLMTRPLLRLASRVWQSRRLTVVARIRTSARGDRSGVAPIAALPDQPWDRSEVCGATWSREMRFAWAESKVLCRIRAGGPYPQAGGISSDEEDGPMYHYAIVAELAGQHRQDLLREARAARLARGASPLDTERRVRRSGVITFLFRRRPAPAV